MTGTFGNIITAGQVEQWIMDFSSKWFLEYLADTEREVGMPPRTYPGLKSIVQANDFDHWSDETLPSLIVMNTGAAEPPVRRGDGKYDASWLMGAAIVVSTPTKQTTRAAMHVYGAAFRTMIIQRRNLERPEIRNTKWVDERPAPMPSTADRSMGAYQMFFVVEVEGVSDEKGSPPLTEPRPDPYVDGGSPLGTVQTTGSQINIRSQP